MSAVAHSLSPSSSLHLPTRNPKPISATKTLFSLPTPKTLFSLPTPKTLFSLPTPKTLAHPISMSRLSPIKASSSSSTPDVDPISVATWRRETLKSRLRNGDTLYGLFLLSFSPTLAEIAGLAGYDFVVVDMEHGPGGIPEALACMRALDAAGAPAILRLPEASAAWAKKALDLGPAGIMFPMVDSPADAEKAVSYCRFPPAGVRGSAHTVVRASRYGLDDGYLANCEEELLVMCQVESVAGAEMAAEIAAVEGVDCIQMGPLDLSASMGYLWDPGHKKVRQTLRMAEKKVLESGKAHLAGFAMPHDPPLELRSRGYKMVSGAVDVGLFKAAAVEDVRRFRAAAKGDGAEDEEVKEDGYWSE